jgi:hypothetical protein
MSRLEVLFGSLNMLPDSVLLPVSRDALVIHRHWFIGFG